MSVVVFPTFPTRSFHIIQLTESLVSLHSVIYNMVSGAVAAAAANCSFHQKKIKVVTQNFFISFHKWMRTMCSLKMPSVCHLIYFQQWHSTCEHVSMSQANTHVVDIPHFCITHAIAMDGEGRTRNKNGAEQFGKKFNTIFRLSGSTLGAPFGSTLFSHTLYFITYFLFLKQNTENAENAARIFFLFSGSYLPSGFR